MRAIFAAWSFLGLTFSFSAHAYIVPTYYMAEKIAKRKPGLESVIAQVEILKANSSADKGPPVSLWQGNVVYISGKMPGGIGRANHWPLMPLFFEPDSGKLLATWKTFGLNVHKEEDLLIKRPKSDKNSQETDSVFYKIEESTSTRRLDNKIAWQINDTANTKKMLVEKDSFLPLQLIGPCPEYFQTSFWSIGGNSTCTLEFRYEVNSGSTLQLPVLTVLKVNDKETVLLRVARVVMNPSEKLLKNAIKPEQKESLEKADELAQSFYKTFLQ